MRYGCTIPPTCPTSRTKYTVIIGRRNDEAELAHMRNKYSDMTDVQIRSFDYLTDMLSERMFSPVPILSSMEMNQVEPRLRNELVNPFRKAIPSGEWRKLTPKLDLDHMSAKNIDLLINATTCNYRLAPFLEDWERLPEEKRRLEWEKVARQLNI
jgi:hypothetical protein